MQSLGYNSEIQHSEGVFQHRQEAARNCVSAAFHFSGSKCRRNPCHQGGTTPQHAAKCQICPNILRFVRLRDQCCFLYFKDGQLQQLLGWGAALFCSSSAPRQPRAPGKRQCAVTWVSGCLSVGALRCVCMSLCWAWESSWTDYVICLSELQSTAASWHKSTSLLSCSSRMFPPGKNATPLMGPWMGLNISLRLRN